MNKITLFALQVSIFSLLLLTISLILPDKTSANGTLCYLTNQNQPGLDCSNPGNQLFGDGFLNNDPTKVFVRFWDLPSQKFVKTAICLNYDPSYSGSDPWGGCAWWSGNYWWEHNIRDCRDSDPSSGNPEFTCTQYGFNAIGQTHMDLTHGIRFTMARGGHGYKDFYVENLDSCKTYKFAFQTIDIYDQQLTLDSQILNTCPTVTPTPTPTPTPLPPSPPPTITITPACLSSSTSSNIGTVSWASTSPAVEYVDISAQPDFSTWSYKQITGGATSTSLIDGFSSGASIIPGTTYYVRTYNGFTHSSQSSTTNFTVPQCQPINVIGRIYNDANANCTKDGSEVYTNQANLTLRQITPLSCSSVLRTPNSFDGNGNFAFNDLSCFDSGSNPSFRLDVVPTISNYAACNAPINTGILNPGETKNLNNIGIKPSWPAWFQTFGGGMYASGIIRSLIPTTAINHALIQPTDDVAVTYSTTINTGNGQISQRPDPWKALDYNVATNYNSNTVFAKLAATADRTNYTGKPLLSHDDASKPYQGVIVYRFTEPSAQLTGDWQNVNFPVIILADSDIAISGSLTNEIISLGADGFLFVMAKGNINISPSIGSADMADPIFHLEGFFSAGLNVTDGGGTKRLNINGSVSAGLFGNGTYVMSRDFNSATANEQYPTNTVTYNGKLFLNTPLALTESKYQWREVR